MNLHGYVTSGTDRARLEQYLCKFDLIWVLNSRTPNILQRWSWPGAHLDIDDVPSTFLRTVAKSATKLQARLRARLEQQLFFRREQHLLRRFSTVSVCSQADRTYLGALEKIHVIPNGFERPVAPPARSVGLDAPRIGFIGLFSYAPNLDGIRWFVEKCWPLIAQSVPGVRLRLVGKETDGPNAPRTPNVDGLGWIADPSAEIATWSAMIIPIRFGGGTRIKLAEAFSRKVPTVSTTLGAFGYEVSNRNQLLIADQALEFSSACIELIRNRTLGVEIAERAWRDFLSNWTWDAIHPKVEAAVCACLGQGRRK